MSEFPFGDSATGGTLSASELFDKVFELRTAGGQVELVTKSGVDLVRDFDPTLLFYKILNNPSEDSPYKDLMCIATEKNDGSPVIFNESTAGISQASIVQTFAEVKAHHDELVTAFDQVFVITENNTLNFTSDVKLANIHALNELSDADKNALQEISAEKGLSEGSVLGALDSVINFHEAYIDEAFERIFKVDESGNVVLTSDTTAAVSADIQNLQNYLKNLSTEYPGTPLAEEIFSVHGVMHPVDVMNALKTLDLGAFESPEIPILSFLDSEAITEEYKPTSTLDESDPFNYSTFKFVDSENLEIDNRYINFFRETNIDGFLKYADPTVTMVSCGIPEIQQFVKNNLLYTYQVLSPEEIINSEILQVLPIPDINYAVNKGIVDEQLTFEKYSSDSLTLELTERFNQVFEVIDGKLKLAKSADMDEIDEFQKLILLDDYKMVLQKVAQSQGASFEIIKDFLATAQDYETKISDVFKVTDAGGLIVSPGVDSDAIKTLLSSFKDPTQVEFLESIAIAKGMDASMSLQKQINEVDVALHDTFDSKSETPDLAMSYNAGMPGVMYDPANPAASGMMPPAYAPNNGSMPGSTYDPNTGAPGAMPPYNASMPGMMPLSYKAPMPGAMPYNSAEPGVETAVGLAKPSILSPAELLILKLTNQFDNIFEVDNGKLKLAKSAGMDEIDEL